MTDSDSLLAHRGPTTPPSTVTDDDAALLAERGWASTREPSPGWLRR